ncbi:MAG: C4-dicarboxylate ABC transporter permease [Alphaproteobacteria bacterium]|nr:C4-dicarboxylate ABC transporter permease [Alphaproteobacteria bacterium]
MEAFSHLGDVVSLANLAAMLLGIVVGLIIGAIPGLGPPMAIALMIPISFTWEPQTALIMMVATYAAGIYGGSFTAILLRAPGTSASAASAIEGFELTKRGKAIEAIRMSTFASVMGGLISGLVLLFLAPPLAKISLWFGPVEFFLVAILGLTAIAAVSFGALLRGLAAGMFGLFVSTIGVDTMTAFPRFTYGATGLLSGVGVLPAVIGLFAFAQALTLCEGSPHTNISGKSKLSWNIWPKFSEIMHCRWSLVRGWSTGLVMGMVPAAGASVAQWIVYSWEIQRGKPGDQFGKGEIKGLAATEGSNNGVTGTSLIPMFVLGIPGGISAAVILGALMIHGLQPGDTLFTKNPEVIYTVMWGFVLANILMGGIAAVLARTMAYSTLVPRGILAPVIMIFCVIGTFTASGNPWDVWIMVTFGFIGYFAEKYRFIPAGILLGIILGPIAEQGFRNTLVLSDGDLISYTATRPIAIVVIVMIIGALYFALKPKKWETAAETYDTQADEYAEGNDD